MIRGKQEYNILQNETGGCPKAFMKVDIEDRIYVLSGDSLIIRVQNIAGLIPEE